MLAKHPIKDIYAEAKAYALKGLLLDKTFIESLASLPSVQEIAERLASTSYGEVIKKPEEVKSSRRLEPLLRGMLALEYHRLGKWFRYGDLLTAYFRRLLGWNLKMVLRAKHQGKSFEEIMDVLYLKAEEILKRRELLVKIAASSTIEEGIELLAGDPFYEPLNRALKVYKEKKDPTAFDLQIDKHVYSEILNSVIKRRRLLKRLTMDKYFWEFVKLDIMKYNITSILRAKLLGLPSSEIKELIVWYEENKDLLKLVEARTVEDAGKYVKRLGFKKVRSAGELASMLRMVEDEAREKEYSLAKSAFYRKTMTPAVVLAYLKLKEREVDTLSKVALGVEMGLPKEEILSSL